MISDIHAIWMREVKKALVDKPTLLIGTVFPILFILIFGAGVDSFVNIAIPGINYTRFFGPGMIALWAMASAQGIGNSIIEDKHGFIKVLLVAPISRTSIFIGKILGEMTFALGSTFLTAIFFLTYTHALSPLRIILSLAFILLIAFGFYGLGLLMGTLFLKSKGYQIAAGIVTTVFIFLSGIFFPAQNLPAWMKLAVAINPLTYGVDALRTVMIGYGEIGLLFDLAVLLAFGCSMIVLGSFAFRRIATK